MFALIGLIVVLRVHEDWCVTGHLGKSMVGTTNDATFDVYPLGGGCHLTIPQERGQAYLMKPKGCEARLIPWHLLPLTVAANCQWKDERTGEWGRRGFAPWEEDLGYVMANHWVYLNTVAVPRPTTAFSIRRSLYKHQAEKNHLVETTASIVKEHCPMVPVAKFCEHRFA
jgi:hypothetical protein